MSSPFTDAIGAHDDGLELTRQLEAMAAELAAGTIDDQLETLQAALSVPTPARRLSDLSTCESRLKAVYGWLTAPDVALAILVGLFAGAIGLAITATTHGGHLGLELTAVATLALAILWGLR